MEYYPGGKRCRGCKKLILPCADNTHKWSFTSDGVTLKCERCRITGTAKPVNQCAHDFFIVADGGVKCTRCGIQGIVN